MPRRYADASWRDKPAKVVTSVPDPGTGQVTVDRILVDEDRPELGWEWNAQWLDPPGRPPGHLAIGDYTTRVSSRSGSRAMVLSTLAETPALEFLIRSRLVQGGVGDGWVSLPPLEQIREL